MPHITSNGIDIYYETYGTGVPIVLISGLGSDHTFWATSIETLSQHYQVIVFDPRGIGQTDMPREPYSITMLADDVAGLMDGLHIEKAHIAGHSMGGCVAQFFASRYSHRVERLVLAATFPVLNVQARLFLDAMLAIYEQGASPKQMYALFVPWLYSAPFLADPEHAAYLVYDENAPNQQPLHAWKNQYLAIRQLNSTTLLASINVPTLIIGGEKDMVAQVNDAQILHSHISNSKFTIIEEVGHMLNFEKPTIFSRHILDFLG